MGIFLFLDIKKYTCYNACGKIVKRKFQLMYMLLEIKRNRR